MDMVYYQSTFCTLGERVCKGKVVSTLFIAYTLSPLTILAISLNIFESLSSIQDDKVAGDDQLYRPANLCDKNRHKKLTYILHV